jgi:hypothetical protein
MNHNAHSPETRRRREKCTATNSFTANIAVPMIHRVLYSSSFSRKRTTKYMTTKNVKRTDPSPPPSFIFLSFFSLRHLQPLQLLLQFLSSGPVQSFPLTRRRCILPIASLPSSTFPCKIIPLYFYSVVFLYSPYWMKQCVPRLHFPKGKGARCNLFGAHLSTRLVLRMAYSFLGMFCRPQCPDHKLAC